MSADAARKEIAKAAQAGHAALHADVGDGALAHRQQFLGLIQSRLDPKLVRCKPEQSFKLPDEVKRRHPDLTRDVFYRKRVLPHLSQQLASPAEAANGILS